MSEYNTVFGDTDNLPTEETEPESEEDEELDEFDDDEA